MPNNTGGDTMIIARIYVFIWLLNLIDCFCGLVVRVLGYRSGGPGSIPGTSRKKKVVGLERGPLSLVSTTEELLDRKVVAPVYNTGNTAVGFRQADLVAYLAVNSEPIV
jgi:hypothetical protein